MSAKNAGLPVPSTRRPFRRIKSKVWAPISPLAVTSKRANPRGTLCFIRKLKIKLIDVLFVEDKRLPEQNVVAWDLELAQRAGLNGLVARFEFRRRQRVRRENSEIPKIFSLPQDHTIRNAVFDIPAILARQ